MSNARTDYDTRREPAEQPAGLPGMPNAAFGGAMFHLRCAEPNHGTFWVTTAMVKGLGCPQCRAREHVPQPGLPLPEDIDSDVVHEAIGAALCGDGAVTHIVENLTSQYPEMDGKLVRDILVAACFTASSSRGSSEDICLHAHGYPPRTREDGYQFTASDGGPMWSMNIVSDADVSRRDYYEVGLMVLAPKSIRRYPATVMFYVLVDGVHRGVRLCSRAFMTMLGYQPSEPTAINPYPACRGFYTNEEAWAYLYRALIDRGYVLPVGALLPYVPQVPEPELVHPTPYHTVPPPTTVQEYGPSLPTTSRAAGHDEAAPATSERIDHASPSCVAEQDQADQSTTSERFVHECGVTFELLNTIWDSIDGPYKAKQRDQQRAEPGPADDTPRDKGKQRAEPTSEHEDEAREGCPVALESSTLPNENSDAGPVASHPETDILYERYKSLVGYDADGEFQAKPNAVDYAQFAQKAKAETSVAPVSVFSDRHKLWLPEGWTSLENERMAGPTMWAHMDYQHLFNLDCVDCTTDSEGVPSLTDPDEQQDEMPKLETAAVVDPDSDDEMPKLETVTVVDTDSDDESPMLETISEADEEEYDDVIPGLA